MASSAEIRERLEYLMDNAPGVISKLNRYNDDPNTPLEGVQLPGYFIRKAGRAEHTYSAAGELFTSRRWLIWIVVQEITNDVSSKETADNEAEDLLDDVIWYLRQHSGLDGANDNGLPGVYGMSLKDNGIEEYQRATKRYSALPILAEIGSYRSS